MNERLHIDLEEGERHPSDQHELREIRKLLMRLDLRLEQIDFIVKRILEREPQPTYPQPTGVSINVT